MGIPSYVISLFPRITLSVGSAPLLTSRVAPLLPGASNTQEFNVIYRICKQHGALHDTPGLFSRCRTTTRRSHRSSLSLERVPRRVPTFPVVRSSMPDHRKLRNTTTVSFPSSVVRVPWATHDITGREVIDGWGKSNVTTNAVAFRQDDFPFFVDSLSSSY